MAKNDSITIYFDAEKLDLKALLDELASFSESKYGDRDHSPIGLLLLEEFLPQVVDRERKLQQERKGMSKPRAETGMSKNGGEAVQRGDTKGGTSKATRISNEESGVN